MIRRRLGRAGALAAPLLLLAAAPQADDRTRSDAAAGAPARSWFWCGVEGATTSGYVTDVQSRMNVTKFRIRALEFQFLQTVNASYGEHLENEHGLCRSFSSVIRAQSALSEMRNQMQREGRTMVVIGTY